MLTNNAAPIIINKLRQADVLAVLIHPLQGFAGLAHPVERHLAKVEVASSSLVTRSNTPFISGLQFGSIAQLVEHLPYKQGVTGSSPVVSTKKHGGQLSSVFFCFSAVAVSLIAIQNITVKSSFSQ